MRPVFVLVVYLAVPGLIPALVAARRSPVVIFLAPLIGAAMAAIAAEIELGLGGSLLTCYLPVVLFVNAAAVSWWLAAGRHWRWPSPPLGWSALTVLVMAGVLVYPLVPLRVPMIGWDANSIWLTHSLMVAGGHHVLLTGLRNPAIFFDNPDYPPLVPAAGALELLRFGPASLHSAVVMTELLTACAIAAVGCLIAMSVRSGTIARLCAVAAGGVVCLAAYGMSYPYAVIGYTDALWAAPAVAAAICGLVLPREPQYLLLAWIFAVVASLTKNEGLTTALVILVLIAFRYKPLGRGAPGRRRAHSTPGLPAKVWQASRQWVARVGYVLVPAIPGLASAAIAKHVGLQNEFFIKRPVGETFWYRADAAAASMAGHLAIAPAAAGVLIIGSCFLHSDRRRAGLANPAWLWLACLGSLIVIFATYAVGQLEIHTWLLTSVARTTIFAQLLLCADIALWLVLAVEAVTVRRRSQQPGDDVIPDHSLAESASRRYLP
jgi:hypothetical protein